MNYPWLLLVTCPNSFYCVLDRKYQINKMLIIETSTGIFRGVRDATDENSVSTDCLEAHRELAGEAEGGFHIKDSI